ncbi:MAG: thiamine phosphate synthase [Burkholderiaceae bacterium]|nr:thiamine phosphate synthase [Burkholderiaceae bacterium]
MRGLYIVTPDWDDTAKLVDVTEQAIKGGAAIVQHRHKTATMELRREQAKALQALCKRYQVPFIVNDFVDLAMELGTDGIHVGESDEAVAAVRVKVGPDMIVGSSCYGDMDRVRAAHKAGASYIALGGFYPSRVKKYPVTTELEIVRQMKQEFPDLPSCAIGGINHANAVPLVERGIDMIAVVSGVYFADDPQAAARKFAQMYGQ